MTIRTALALALCLAALAFNAAAADEKKADSPANTLSRQEIADGWRLLFDGKSLDDWRVYRKPDAKGWTVKDGAIYLEKPGSGDLMTKDKFGNFEFTVDWKMETGNNSGIIYRVTEEGGGPSYNSGPEVQVMNHKSTDKLGKNAGGSLYDMYAPTANTHKPADEWNTYKVVCNGKRIEHWVNGAKVVDCQIGSEDWNQRLAASKWKNTKLFASQPTGHIALQDHGSKIYFRNAKIKVLPQTKE